MYMGICLETLMCILVGTCDYTLHSICCGCCATICILLSVYRLIRAYFAAPVVTHCTIFVVGAVLHVYGYVFIGAYVYTLRHPWSHTEKSLLWVLCYFRGFARLGWGTSECPASSSRVIGVLSACMISRVTFILNLLGPWLQTAQSALGKSIFRPYKLHSLLWVGLCLWSPVWFSY